LLIVNVFKNAGHKSAQILFQLIQFDAPFGAAPMQMESFESLTENCLN
jgi:hypothetical protein